MQLDSVFGFYSVGSWVGDLDLWFVRILFGVLKEFRRKGVFSCYDYINYIDSISKQ